MPVAQFLTENGRSAHGGLEVWVLLTAAAWMARWTRNCWVFVCHMKRLTSNSAGDSHVHDGEASIVRWPGIAWSSLKYQEVAWTSMDLH